MQLQAAYGMHGMLTYTHACLYTVPLACGSILRSHLYKHVCIYNRDVKMLGYVYCIGYYVCCISIVRRIRVNVYLLSSIHKNLQLHKNCLHLHCGCVLYGGGNINHMSFFLEQSLELILKVSCHHNGDIL